MLAAFNANGKTILKNCAIEPEVKDLVKFLNTLGGRIKVVGRQILIIGCKKIKKHITHEVIFDRIELGTYMIAAALVGKKVILNKIESRVIQNEIDVLKKMGVKLKAQRSTILFKSNNIKKNKSFNKAISWISN